MLLVFGAATVAGIWATGLVVDRRPRLALLTALTLCAGLMVVLGRWAGEPVVLLGAVALWGGAFGGAPTLIQTALVDASGPAAADVATSLQATVYNAGIAGGSLTGGSSWRGGRRGTAVDGAAAAGRRAGGGRGGTAHGVPGPPRRRPDGPAAARYGGGRVTPPHRDGTRAPPDSAFPARRGPGRVPRLRPGAGGGQVTRPP
ncbi:hypothetical protein [Streptomyces galbus]|uniref:hypothetical protein n=1 Tax=Streptomyces galbus TaxID=33898 RepID=UPI003EBF45B2